MYTLAIPDHSSRYAIQLTAVPLKARVARALVSIAITHDPPLHGAVVFVYHVPPEYAIAGAFCSNRDGGGGAAAVPVEVTVVTSKASTHIHAPPDNLLRVPVAVTVRIWLLEP